MASGLRESDLLFSLATCVRSIAKMFPLVDSIVLPWFCGARRRGQENARPLTWTPRSERPKRRGPCKAPQKGIPDVRQPAHGHVLHGVIYIPPSRHASWLRAMAHAHNCHTHLHACICTCVYCLRLLRMLACAGNISWLYVGGHVRRGLGRLLNAALFLCKNKQSANSENQIDSPGPPPRTVNIWHTCLQHPGSSHPRAPSIHVLQTLPSNVLEYDLLSALWSPRDTFLHAEGSVH